MSNEKVLRYVIINVPKGKQKEVEEVLAELIKKGLVSSVNIKSVVEEPREL